MIKTLSNNSNRKIISFTKIYTCRRMQWRNWNINLMRLKETSKRLSISWGSLKVRGISIRLSWIKRTLPKDSSNTNSNNSWTNYIFCPKKRDSGRKKISHLLMKLKTSSIGCKTTLGFNSQEDSHCLKISTWTNSRERENPPISQSKKLSLTWYKA